MLIETMYVVLLHGVVMTHWFDEQNIICYTNERSPSTRVKGWLRYTMTRCKLLCEKWNPTTIQQAFATNWNKNTHKVKKKKH